MQAYHLQQMHENKGVIGAPGYPAAEVEAYCEEHYRATQELLRTSVYYDGKTNAYRCTGVGSPSYAMVTAARQDDNYLYLDYQVLSHVDDRTPIRGGLLSVVLVGDTWRYNYNMQWSSTEQQIVKPAKELINDLDALNRQYVTPLVAGGFAHKSWETAAEIPPVSLVQFFASHNPDSYDTPIKTPIWNPMVDGARVESFVRFYFHIPSENMRKGNEYYDAESHRYWLPGLGGATNSKVIAAVLEGDILTLTVAVDQDGTPIANGTLTIRQRPENGYEYLSMAVTEP